MKHEQLIELLMETPIVAAVKNDEGLEKCLTCDAQVVFVLYGDVVNIGEKVARIKEAGKAAFVHIDLIDGLAAREVAVDFISKNTQADGIISTKYPLVRYAKSLGLITIQRFFLLDSMALVNIQKQMTQDAADLIEILPGVMPKIIHKLVSHARKPIIAGGLICDKEDVVSALGAGATAISSTDPNVWFL
ncbi:glycerol-3-phosphate responsive antiterminator [Oscillospiraceae bacterium PP1C4]